MISYGDIKSGEVAVPAAKSDANSIPSLIDRASKRLAEAKTSAEVLEAKAAAELALHYAKVTKAANESHADCLRIITRAEIRMASEIDRGQDAGEVAKPGRKVNVPASDNKATMAELGVSRQRVNEWRKVAEAGEEKVEEAISGALADGRAPTKADVHRAAGIVKDKPKSDEDQQFADLMSAWSAASEGARARFMARNNLTKSPETADEMVGGFPVAAAPYHAEETGGLPEHDNKDGHRTSDAGVTGGESAADDGRDVEATGGAASVITYSHSAAPAVEAVAAVPQAPSKLATAENSPDPRDSGGATAVPATQALQIPAQNDDAPRVVGQGGPEPVNIIGHAVREDASVAQAGNEAGRASEATVTNSKPDCLNPDICNLHFTSALCWKCNDARTRRKLA